MLAPLALLLGCALYVVLGHDDPPSVGFHPESGLPNPPAVGAQPVR
jgi:hypothetical protein